MYHYLYKITCTKGRFKNKFYYGKHSTNNLDDGYKGSGKFIIDYYKKYPNDYIKEIISFYNSKEELDKAEYDLIDKWLGNINCLNISKGGTGGAHPAWNKGLKGKQEAWNKGLPKEQQPAFGKSKKGIKWSDEAKERNKGKVSNFKGHKQTNYAIQKSIEVHKGKSLTEEHKRKIGDALKGRKNGPLTEEHKRKIGDAHKGKSPINKGQKNMYKWMTNGINSFFVYSDNWNEFINNGYIFGRKLK